MANNVRAPFLFAPSSSPPPLSPSATPPPPPSPPLTPTLGTFGDLELYPEELEKKVQPQSTMVVLDKRPNGRPPSPKNRPKPTMDNFKPTFLMVPAGMDIVNAIIDFSRKKDVSIIVHHALGAISEVNIFDPLSPSNCSSFQGNLQMISLSGFCTQSISSSKNIPYSSFNVQFLMNQTYQIFGGPVGHKLIAAEPLHVFAFIIKKHEYQGMVNPITNPNVQSLMMSTHDTHYVANALIGNTNNNVNHLDFSVGASTSSTSMNTQVPDALPKDVNML